MTEILITTLVMALVFAAVVLLVLAAAPLFGKRTDLNRRLAGEAQAATGAGPSLRTDDSASLWAKLVLQIEKRGLSLTDTKSDVLTEKLMLAGFEQAFAVRAFVLVRTTLTLALPILAIIFMAITGDWPAPTKLYMTIVGSAVVGLYLPNFWISSRASKRKKDILNGFPDTLDLMLVCVEAGLGIDAAFSRVGAEIAGSHPLLAELFANVSLELRAGRSREVALRNLSRRTAVPEIGAFVTLIVQSDRLGASIGQALKIYAGEMREARRMRAEEKAHRIPVLLSIPIVCFLLPCMVAVLMLPAAIGMKTSMAQVKSNSDAKR